jgi:hypothetical protein
MLTRRLAVSRDPGESSELQRLLADIAVTVYASDGADRLAELTARASRMAAA